MAASKSRVRVDGVTEVQRALKALEAQTADLKEVHVNVAGKLVPGIALRSPRRTGALAGSWSAGATKSRARMISSVPYSGVIEYGWAARGIAGAHMAEETIKASQPEIVAAYEGEIARLAARDGLEVHK